MSQIEDPPQTPPDWTLQPGEQILRKDLHKTFAGRGQGGIGPSAKSPNVFIFTDPSSGEQHGYIDQWMEDGTFHYTGEGQRGDQQMVQGNAAILNHAEEGRALRVFEGASGVVTYVGEFRLADTDSWYHADAPETGGGPVRKVIVFRLVPIDAAPQPADSRLEELLKGPTVERVPIEEQFTERAVVDPAREPIVAERREASLVGDFRSFLEEKRHRVTRLKIVPDGERKPLFSDLYDETAEVLYEAKGSVTREAIRMAIGQLADYGRFEPAAQTAILVPEPPRADLIALAESQGHGLVWRVGRSFATSGRMLW